MEGFKKGRRTRKLAEGGLIRGPGTGASDSIPAEIPEGSYIMPADSTDQLGVDLLDSMGSPIPARVSDGEFHLPPEQVHALGEQVLDQIRNATHAPTGFMPGSRDEKPELYFADGGGVWGGARRRRRNDEGRIPESPETPGSSNGDGRSGPGGSLPPPSRRGAQSFGRPQPITLSGSTELATAGGPGPAGPGQPRLGFDGSKSSPRGSRPNFFVRPDGAASTTLNTLPEAVQRPAPAALEAPQRGGAQPREPDYRARAETKARAKADSARWGAEQAATDARFAAAGGQQPPVGRGGFRGGVDRARAWLNRLDPSSSTRTGRFVRGAGVGIPAAIEAGNVFEVATDPDSTKLDVATQTAEGMARTGGGFVGAATGAKVGAALLTPVFPPLGPAVGAVAGGTLGWMAGSSGADRLVEAGRGILTPGGDTRSPIERTAERQAQTRDDRSGAAVAMPAGAAVNSDPRAASWLESNSQPTGPGLNARNTRPVDGMEGVSYAGNYSGTDVFRGTGANNEAAFSDLENLATTRGGAPAPLPREGEKGWGNTIASSDFVRPMTSGGFKVNADGSVGYAPSELEVARQAALERGDFEAVDRSYMTSAERASVDEQKEMNRLRSRAARRDPVATYQAELEDRAGRADRGFRERAGRVLDQLFARYEASSDDSERAQILNEIRAITGESGGEGNLRNNFLTRTVKQFNDMGEPAGETQEIVDLRTGQVLGSGASQLPPLRENPAVIAIVNDTSLSREERAAKIRALGYQ